MERSKESMLELSNDQLRQLQQDEETFQLSLDIKLEDEIKIKRTSSDLISSPLIIDDECYRESSDEGESNGGIKFLEENDVASVATVREMNSDPEPPCPPQEEVFIPEVPPRTTLARLRNATNTKSLRVNWSSKYHLEENVLYYVNPCFHFRISI